jgi:Leucine-rich repeat (LRR) protein
VELSSALTPAQKKQKNDELKSERSTISNEWWNAAKFQDATTLVSRCTKLTEFSQHTKLPNITTLDLQNNQLSSIDLSNNKSLNFLNLFSNELTSINLSPLANLTVLWLYENKIRQINLASNEHLAWISLGSNGLESLQLPSRGSIAVLYVDDNQLKEFRFFYDPAIFSSHDFGLNPQGCSITVAYDKKNSNKAQ